jgi:protein O-mannosyl-transferase
MAALLKKINKLSNLQAAVIILLTGVLTYGASLKNPFLGDDFSQIVSNPIVHSISNIKLFFEGGTFYNGQGVGPELYGVYFRPLMTITFSVLYTLFGAHSFFFHLLQLLLCIGSAVLLYLIFRFTFSPLMALPLALIFLVHPLDSQAVFAIPAMQDALFFFFGVLGIWLLFRFSSLKSIAWVALCLTLSLFAKETGLLFIAMALLFLFCFDRRKRLYTLLMIMLPVVATWLILKIHAVGLVGVNPNNAPIDYLGFTQRLFTVPSVMLLYVSKFIFPGMLSSAYYWTYPTFSIQHVLLPLVIDLSVIAFFVYTGLIIYRRTAEKAVIYTYIFFGTWFVLGLMPILQLKPLDMTAAETWFYFPMAGLLGLIGMSIIHLRPRIKSKWGMAIIPLLILCLVGRTVIRGTNWKDTVSLAESNVAVSKSDDYVAYNNIAINYYNHKQYLQAKLNAKRSIQIFPNDSAYNTLGHIYQALEDYPAAAKAYTDGLAYPGSLQKTLYDNLGFLTFQYGDPASQRLLLQALNKFPSDSNLWLYLALAEYKSLKFSESQYAISQAYKYEPSNAIIKNYYYRITHQLPI